MATFVHVVDYKSSTLIPPMCSMDAKELNNVYYLSMEHRFADILICFSLSFLWKQCETPRRWSVQRGHNLLTNGCKSDREWDWLSSDAAWVVAERAYGTLDGSSILCDELVNFRASRFVFKSAMLKITWERLNPVMNKPCRFFNTTSFAQEFSISYAFM